MLEIFSVSFVLCSGARILCIDYNKEIYSKPVIAQRESSIISQRNSIPFLPLQTHEIVRICLKTQTVRILGFGNWEWERKTITIIISIPSVYTSTRYFSHSTLGKFISHGRKKNTKNSKPKSHSRI